MIQVLEVVFGIYFKQPKFIVKVHLRSPYAENIEFINNNSNL